MSDQKSSKYVQFGAGNQAVPGWLNFDASPTLRIQKIPVIGRLFRSRLNCIFDEEILYGDIVRGLPVEANSVDGLFCSHVLEHLSYEDFRIALRNSFTYMKPGGLFRIVVPDLGFYIAEYLKASGSDSEDERARAAKDFCEGTCFGKKLSRAKLRRRLTDAFSNSDHRWMWDYPGLTRALVEHGFTDVRLFQEGSCSDEMLLRPERPHQFGVDENYGLAVECIKPIEI